jgi:GTP-sensing pleiotropic transcriptional regulator CodY
LVFTDGNFLLVTTKGITIGNEKNEEEKKKKDVSLSQTKITDEICSSLISVGESVGNIQVIT